MQPRYITILRYLIALILTILGFVTRNWLLLPLAAVLAGQAYRGGACGVCEAGFCPKEEKK